MSHDEHWVVDRIEDGEIAVLVSSIEGTREVPLASLPPGSSEGDALRQVDEESEGGELRFHLDSELTARLRATTAGLRAKLRRGPSGDLAL